MTTNSFKIELPEHWTFKKVVTYAVFERHSDCEQPVELTFHCHKGYQWRLHKLEGEVRAYEMAEICTLLRFLGEDEWNRIEDSHVYGDPSLSQATCCCACRRFNDANEGPNGERYCARRQLNVMPTDCCSDFVRDPSAQEKD